MKISNEKIQELALKWLQGETSPSEEKILFDWYNEHQAEDLLLDDPLLYDEDNLKARMLGNMAETTGVPFMAKKIVPLWNRSWFRIAAASVLIILITSAWYITTHTTIQPEEMVAVNKKESDIAPGGATAMLTLGNGKKLSLDGSQNGMIANEADVDIIKEDGKVSYVGKAESNTLVYNTISTPRKGQYHLVLADGTKVWLDAESSIRFPVAFAEDKRMVEITGQAYFEIAKDPKKPFHVNLSAGNTNIQVLGTQFNIMAYKDESAVRTTLLEGAVKVNSAEASLLLKPGQQAAVKETGNIHLIKSADLVQAVAWKNGMFHLGSTPISEIMRQVSRWYDAEVEYTGDISKLVFSGEVSRKKHLSELLNILEATGTIKFQVEGNKITVISKK